MAALIKNQLVKHLSKFTKNLSPDKIQLSTLKGEGELTNLELNEDVLMELMDLPTWLKLTKATCNRVTIQIPWSKLKSQPIKLCLDEVSVAMEMCEKLREPKDSSKLPSYSTGGRYSFGDRVVDGMFLQINSVVIAFTSHAFSADLAISRIIIQSTTPTWRVTNDLKNTRISEKQHDLLLAFKQIEWQTLRMEADCMVGDRNVQTTPLRLITNQSKLRIATKKRYSDCSTVSTKLQFLMDDLLWILTDSQMKAAVVFARHIKHQIDKASEQSKLVIAKEIQRQQSQDKPKSQSNQSSSSNSSSFSPAFTRFDIQQTSYHINTGRIDVHICDDINVERKNRGVDGGAVGVAVMKLSISHYPSRLSGQSRARWSKYDDNMESRDRWVSKLLENYTAQLTSEWSIWKDKLKPNTRPIQLTNSLIERLTMLSVEDFFITTASRDNDKGDRPKKFLFSDKKSLLLPPDMAAVHLEHAEYFFSHKAKIPTPCANMYLKINPIKLVLDTYTLSWFNSFGMSLAKDVELLIAELPITDTTSKKERVELKVDALMPKVVLPVPGPVPLYQHDRPDSLQMSISRILITNNHWTRCSDSTSIETHNALRTTLQDISLHQPNFPNAPEDLKLITDGHSSYSTSNKYFSFMNTDYSLASLPEVISISLEQFWLEFTGVKNAGVRPVSFVESFPISLWISIPQSGSLTQSNGSPSPSQTVGVMVDIGAKICAQINHYQFCFLMRLADTLTNLGQTIADEAKLHEDEFTEQILPSTMQSTVIVKIREVQFALLAAPQVGNTEVGSTEVSSTEVGNEDRKPNMTNDIASDSHVDNLEPNSFEQTSGSITEPSKQEEEVAKSDDGEIDGDSGVDTLSFRTTSENADLYLEKSVFYKSTTSETGPPQNPKSTFYTGSDGLSSPSHETTSKFSSVFSKMTTRVKTSLNKVVDDSDSWDTLSLTSGLSDDNDYLTEVIGQDEEAAFTCANTAGFADDEESMSNLSSIVTERPKQLFSVTIFKICGIEAAVQVVGLDMVAKVVLASLSNEEIGNKYYDEFQEQQLADMKRLSPMVDTPIKPVAVRFTQGPSAAHLSYRADEKGFAHIKVQDYSLVFLASTVDKLGPLFKDEVVAEPLPMLVEISNFDLELQDNGQPVYSTDTPSVPIQIHIDRLAVTRDITGVLTIKGIATEAVGDVLTAYKAVRADKSTNTVASADFQQRQEKKKLESTSSSAQLVDAMQLLQSENKTMKDQILRLNEKLIEKDHEEFTRVEANVPEDYVKLRRELEFYTKETKLLRAQVLEKSEEIDALQTTKDCLTETIEVLKRELDKHT